MIKNHPSRKRTSAARIPLSQLIDFLPDPTFAIDLKGRVIVWNRAIEELTAIKAKDMLGKSDYEYALPFYGIRRPMLADHILDPAKEFRENFTYLKRENDFILAKGEVEINRRKLTLWGKASPIHDSKGKIIGAIESVRDITEAMQTEEALRNSEARYKDIFYNVSDLLYIHDLKGNVIETNLASKKSTGYTQDDLKEMNLKDILPDRYKARFEDYISRVLKNGYDEGLMTIITKNGDERIMEYRNSLILDSDGRPSGVRGSARDITSRTKALKQLRKERDLIASIIETSPAFYDAIDPQGRVIFMNQAMLNALGYTLSEVIGKDYLSCFVHEDDSCALRAALDGMVSSGKPLVHENRVLARGRRALLVQWQGKAIFRDTGELEFIFGIGIDVTGQRLLYKALHESEEKYRKIFENASEGIYQTTPDGRLLNVNPALARMFGFTSPAEMIEKIRDIGRELYVNPDDRERMLRILMEKGVVEGLEVEMRRQDKSTFWISIHLHPVHDAQGNISYLEGTNVDISNRRKTAEALRFSEDKFSRVFQTNPSLMAINTLADLRFIDVNETFLQTLGYSKEEVIGKTPEEIGNFPDPLKFKQAILTFMDQGTLRNYELSVRTKDGLIRYGLFSGDVIKLQDKELWLTVMTDITEKRKTEEALRESEEKFRRMAEVSPEIFWMATLDWSRTIYVSPAFERITGITLDEAYRDPRVFLEIVHQDDMSLVKSVIETIQEQDMEFEFRIIRKDGSMRWISFRSSLIIDEQGNPLYLTGIAEDITERKLSEEERNTYEARLMRSQKLEAIGTLAGGIAHDFNNILSAIIGYSELSLDELPQDSTVRDSIHEILKAGDRARDLVKQILTFSRKMETEYRPIRIQVIAREALKLLRSSIPSTISITEHIDPDASPVLADASQIHQIIMNLCTNAYHAMLPAGGEMTISLEQLFLDSEFTALHPGLHEGIYLRLVVSDTGCGMDAETLKRIFDPFFTTKEKGKGTGLGLATVHGIVTSLGGAAFVSSLIEHGSTFELYLPVHQGELEVAHEPEEVLMKAEGETILLVDDEEAILQFSKTMLEQLGYRVDAISSSLSALEAFRASPDRYDLLITDQTMPAMAGSTLAGKVLKIRQIPIILMTGYSETITPEEALEQGIEEYLEKPFTRVSLASAIHRCLGK